ncbi:hypothetical protein TSUD_172180 [Trifolium subterraneum]|uniref:Non-haem dioxygenase N-terminal domain-containing protein n=1 Tax=Trifolium subterraneum TaxID=3900 RepID=A0A2Z6LUS6_TRISU|nr:hypothetical protein TSUD_172180 [Trifolium subterraneum]
MGSETTCPMLPVIDFSNLEDNWKLVKSQVYEVVTEYSCFEANVFDDKVPFELRKAIFGSLEELFDLPLEKKETQMFLDDFDKINHMTNIWWPQGNPSFSKTIHSYSQKLSELDQAWSNGRLHSPFHRVMMSGNEEKYTIVFFSIPNKGYIIKAPEELVDVERPSLFKPFDHAEYVDYLSTEKAQTDKLPLRSFCGV